MTSIQDDRKHLSADGVSTRKPAARSWTDERYEGYQVTECCACRWVWLGEDCGHPESDGITSPHDHCIKHGGQR